MPDWEALRKLARETHYRLCEISLKLTGTLPAAEELLSAAEIETGLDCSPLPANDPILVGAFALLDREGGNLYFQLSPALSSERIRFIKAHEFAHFWLHPQFSSDAECAEDSPETYLGGTAEPDAKQVESGYSPAERQEKEANVFAAEFLLPSDKLARLFEEDNWSAERLAKHTGLSETLVLSQLSHALLSPPELESPSPSSNEKAPKATFLLDPSQLRAATLERGPALVDAGPGTGKTRTLTSRITHLLNDLGVPPEKIIALTFSRKAAAEMQARLQEAVGEQANRVWIGTFHSFGLEILRKEGGRIGLPPRPAMLSNADAVGLLLEKYRLLNLREYQYLHKPTLPFPDILACISRAKDELKTPEECLKVALKMAETAVDPEATLAARKALEVANVYAIYQNELQARGMLDFGDLLFRAVQLFESFPEVRSEWQARYPHILADEYQDVNRACARLLQSIAGEGAGFWAVGDLRQAIYRFRGASPANIRRFEEDFPGGVRLKLNRNYRSVPQLVSLFNDVASRMDGERTEWEAVRSKDSLPTYLNDSCEAPLRRNAILSLALPENRQGQYEWLGRQIQERRAKGVTLKDQAILVPTNRQAADLAAELSNRGVPVQHLGDLFERAEVKDLLSVLSLACEPEGTALWRVASFPEYAIPASDASLILKSAKAGDFRFPEFLADASAVPGLSEQGRQGVSRLWETLKPNLHRGNASLFLMRYLFNSSNYLQGLSKREADEVSRNTERLQRIAISILLEFVQETLAQLPKEDRDERGFLKRLRFLFECGEAKMSRTTEALERLDAVRIMTVHQSKGLEFPVVYLPNLVKGQFPTRGRGKMAKLPNGLIEESSEEEENTSDEALFFVALTRARDTLALSRPLIWKEKLEPASTLLERIEPMLDQNGVVTVRSFPPISVGNQLHQSQFETEFFASEANDKISDSLKSDDSTSESPIRKLSLRHFAVKEYMNCPRRYYYREVARVPEPQAETPYLDFHVALQASLDRLQERRDAGVEPELKELTELFEEKWNASSPDETNGHRSVLHSRACELIEFALAQPGVSFGAPVSKEFRAELPSGSIFLRSDRAELNEDGALFLTKIKKRARKSDDHTDIELALLRLAAQQRTPGQKIEIELRFLSETEPFLVPDKPKLEEKRVAKYEEALQRLAIGDFAPAPAPSVSCPDCPYYLICEGAKPRASAT